MSRLSKVLIFLLGSIILVSEARAATCPAPPTKPAKGVTCQDPETGLNVTRVTDWAADGLSGWTRNDYSKRQPFNSNKTRFVTYGPSGYWQLYNASTFARIKQLSGVAGDAELQWHPTDPNKFWFMGNNGGFQIYLYDITDDSHPTVANFQSRVQTWWPTVVGCRTGSEGSPSFDGRYWAFMCYNSSWNDIGIFTYDLQTDTILAHMNSDPGSPNYVGMSPSGNYIVAAWWTGQVQGGDAGRTRIYTRDLSDWTYVECTIQHSDLGIGLNGHDYYIGVDYSDGNDSPGIPHGADCVGGNGYVFTRDINAGWVSHGYAGSRVDILPMYAEGTTTGVHLSGRANNGKFAMSVHSCTPYTGSCPSSLSDRVFTSPFTGGYTKRMRMNVVVDSYWTEPHGALSRDGSKFLVNSNWGTGGNDNNIDVYMLDIPDAFIITTTSLPNGTSGQAYSQDVHTAGGTQPPTNCQTFSGSLPSGLSWSIVGDACRLSGTHTGTGTFNFTLRATDSASATADQALQLVYNATLQIDTISPMSNGSVGAAYLSCVTASGGTQPYSFTKLSGSVPTGLTLGSNGCFTGTASTLGTFNFTARVTDNVSATADKALQITITTGSIISLRTPIINPGHNYAFFSIGATGMDFDADCQIAVLDNGGATVETINSYSGPAIRTVKTATTLTASSNYSIAVTCVGTTPDQTNYPFTTLATPSGGNRTIPISLKPSPIISSATRVTVDYGTPSGQVCTSSDVGTGSIQNTSCGSGCTVNLTIPAGLYCYRHRWQNSSDTVLATSSPQPLQVQ